MTNGIQSFFQALNESPWSHIVLLIFAVMSVYLGITIGDALRKLLFDDER